MEPTRELLWGVSKLIVSAHYLAFLVALVIFLLGCYRWLKIILSGRNDEKRLDNLPKRVWWVIKDGLFFVRLALREGQMGLMHLLVLWGFIILTIGTITLTIAERVTSEFFRGTFYLIFEFTMDLAGLFLILGLAIATVNRYIFKPSRFQKPWKYAKDDGAILALLIIIALLGFIVEALRISSGQPAFTAFIGGILANVIPYSSSAYQAMWIVHSLLAMLFIAAIPYTKLFHVVAAPLNILTRSERRGGREILDEEYMGAIEATDLQWRDLLSSIACMRCGRCQDNCPAFNSGTTLSPMYLMQNLRKTLNDTFDFFGRKKEETLLLDSVIDMDAVWACTTCKACMEMCPIYIEQMEIIGEVRRGVVESGEAPPDVRDILNNIQKQRNLWGEAKWKRDAWMKDIDVPKAKETEFEWLLWVGCQVYDAKAKEVAKKLVRILNEIGVSYAVLGREEGCCGNEARRLGEEGLFQLLKEENISTFEKYGVEKLIAVSPHCYNTFRNEYEINTKFVLEVILEAIKDGRLKFKKEINKKVTFHDPCYLGRWNGIYDLPREILKSIPGIELVEMPRNKERSFCCGGGGGNLVREYPGEDRPNNIRAREAAETGAEILAVACPFCAIMLEDGVKTQKLDDRIEVKDVIELVYEAAFD